MGRKLDAILIRQASGDADPGREDPETEPESTTIGFVLEQARRFATYYAEGDG